MKYIEETNNPLETGNTLIISKTPETKEGSYWITLSFKSIDKKVSLASRNMSMQLFVKGGEIINRTITVKENPYIISITSHKYVGDVYDDASYISIDYANHNATRDSERVKHDDIVLENTIRNENGEEVRNILTKEKEREAITELLNINSIFLDKKALLDLFQVELINIKNLIKDDRGLATDCLYFKDYEAEVNKVFASRRSLSQNSYLKKQK